MTRNERIGIMRKHSQQIDHGAYAMTFQAIGDELGISAQRAEQLYLHALFIFIGSWEWSEDEFTPDTPIVTKKSWFRAA